MNVTAALIYAIREITFAKGCPCLLLFVLMSEEGLGLEAMEEKEGRKVNRKEECHAFINNRKVTPVLSVALESEVIMHSWHHDT